MVGAETDGDKRVEEMDRDRDKKGRMDGVERDGDKNGRMGRDRVKRLERMERKG